MKELPIWEKVLFTIEEAAAYSNIGVNKIREISNDPRCPFILYNGNRRLIKRREFEKYLEKIVEL